MALQKGDVTDITQMDTIRIDAQRGQVPVVRITFKLRGTTNVTIFVDQGADFGKRATEAILKEATERIMVLDQFA